ncbi:MAG TPA: dTMP kinase [Cyanobacteria bacterium UBA8803]|nr:dTMP kinase [Cyanobacteria bacterium UBA9273]HBL57660.1 dTMP kinase [Cyanobacteria bacterium UBA8803]
MQGKLIVFEGVEGSGKTTQLERSRDWLLGCGLQQCLGEFGNQIPVVVTREPGGTSLGLGLRQLLLEGQASPIQDRAELLLYGADRAQHVEEFLKPQLAKGVIILCDRYTDSTIAYQGYGRGLDLGLIQQLNQIATGGLESHLTLWLDVDAEIGLKRARQRGAADRMEQAELAFHQRVQQGFTQLALSYPQRIVRIDASQSQEEVHLAIREILCQRLKDEGMRG